MSTLQEKILYAVDEAKNALDLASTDGYPGGVIRLDTVFETLDELAGHVVAAFESEPSISPQEDSDG